MEFELEIKRIKERRSNSKKDHLKIRSPSKGDLTFSIIQGQSFKQVI